MIELFAFSVGLSLPIPPTQVAPISATCFQGIQVMMHLVINSEVRSVDGLVN